MYHDLEEFAKKIYFLSVISKDVFALLKEANSFPYLSGYTSIISKLFLGA